VKYWQSQLARRLAASPPRLAYSSASQHRNMGKRAFRRANVIIGSHSRSRTPRILRPNFRASSKNSTEMPKSRSCSGRSRQTGSRQGTHGGFLAVLHQGPFFKHAGMRPDTATGLALRTVRKLDWALRPILRSMEDARDFYRLFCDLIDDDVGQRSEKPIRGCLACERWRVPCWETRSGLRILHRPFGRRGARLRDCRDQGTRRCAPNPQRLATTIGVSKLQEPLKALADLLMRQILTAL
jgi:hypothetical protein